ncbi:hypothetical protein [Nocardiopsis ganjiahuensis]|uniref:hypothetical protein n=1 Tax=Nocardiopsis ganjiahuensis TaxID=239984 RepID=UPI000594F76A|nr:hypothetical protein [Nocardiopsis ganjiahuensis]
MNERGHWARTLSRIGRTGVIFSLLLSTAALLMVWTWTGGAVFLMASGAPVVAVLLIFLGGHHQGAFEVVGGPLDGARLPPEAVGPSTKDLVLRTPGGGGARYAVASSRSLVYKGQSEIEG